ncbi:putative DNA binding domain-containing protein [Herbivorax sp. ANBcel31]|uniref:AlbA family DNA-binding domain-containing protein n=1 Tax=Herbivorax sp. ANBcel31 TaxID=3069754 RepID=UPI0027B431A7|nr:RNA-binding domain-containing protein [Herbivorax sp. ANBcel31]MDQ2087697.1 putative DNA binding domain-containing protein [Herbivorax sp. ANBcel31]
MDINKLMRLLKREEGPKLDFKAEINLSTYGEKKELAKDVIAMANSRGGRGYIVFGVEDKTKKILGINPKDYKEEQIQQVIYNRCDPPVAVSVDLIEFKEKTLGVLTIYKSNHRPHQMIQNGAFYIRRGSTTDKARRNEIANLLQENGLMTYETVVLKNAGLDEIDEEFVKNYFKRLGVISESPSEILMEALGIIGEKVEGDGYSPTIGGLLLFGKNPFIRLPQVHAKVVHNDKVDFFYGNILSMLDDISKFLKDLIKDKEYPFEALEEVIANALVHRDYLDNSRGVTINIAPKFIEITNPGALIADNSVYLFSKGNNPYRRNSWLYQRVLTLDYKKRFMKSGIGMKRIKNSFVGMGRVKFINIGSQNLFKVLLPRNGK